MGKKKFEILIEHPDGDKQNHELVLRKEDPVYDVEMIILL